MENRTGLARRILATLLPATLMLGCVCIGAPVQAAKTKVSISQTKLSLKAGGSATLTLKGVKKKDYSKEKWTTTKKAVAAVTYDKKTGKAVVRGVGDGSATIWVKFKGSTYTCKVTVKAYTTSKVQLDPSWTYADKAAITGGTAILYTPYQGQKGKTIAINAPYGTDGDSTLTIPIHPDGSGCYIEGAGLTGDKTVSAVPSDSALNDGTMRSTANLVLARTLRDVLLKNGYSVLMIRDGETVALDSIARTVIANNKADVSITINYYEDSEATEDSGTFFCAVPWDKEYRSMTPVKDNFTKLNRLGFNLISGVSEQGLKVRELGAREMDSVQTAYSTIPAVILEAGNRFADHSAAANNKIASGVIRGLEHFFEEKADPADNFGFVKIGEEIPELIQEIRYYTSYNFVGQRVDGYEAPIAYMTREAAYSLKKASDALIRQGYRIKVFDAYRPQMAVDHFVRWAEDLTDVKMKSYFYPEVDKSRLFAEGYIDMKSGHSRGSTIDLTLFDMKTEREVDMGGTFDFFGELSHPDYRGITDAQYENRMILQKAMLDAGYAALFSEWWHFRLDQEPHPDTYFTFKVTA